MPGKRRRRRRKKISQLHFAETINFSPAQSELAWLDGFVGEIASRTIARIQPSRDLGVTVRKGLKAGCVLGDGQADPYIAAKTSATLS
jgi:hypothetical protein